MTASDHVLYHHAPNVLACRGPSTHETLPDRQKTTQDANVLVKRLSTQVGRSPA